MARKKVDETDHANDSHPAVTEDPGKAAAKPSSRSDTATSATRARAVMQRRHLRIGFGMTAAVGIEVAGAAGLIIGGFLPWAWGEPLWGQSEPAAVVVQVSLVLAVLSLGVAWSGRAEPLPARSRVAALLGVAAAAVVAVSLVWQAPLGSRGAGMVLVALACALVAVGTVSWLIGLRRLRVLFPFGLADAHRRGYGNLPAVRRAQWVGGPVGVVSAAALVAGALVVVPGWVTTIDSQTATGLALTDGSPAPAGEDPAWAVTVPAAHESHPSTTWATADGLIIEEGTGVRAVDPRTGEPRWHWRDDAYRRVAGVLAGGTVVLALDYQGDATGRDKLVALDPATGELRWEQFNDQLVEAMSNVAWAPADGDWFMIPEQAQSPTVEEAAPLSLRSIDTSDGTTRWQVTEEGGCALAGVDTDANGVVVTTLQCIGDGAGPAGCRVSGLDPATGDELWSWPADNDPAADCQVTTTENHVIVSSQVESTQQAVALQPTTGEPLWTSDADDDLAGLRSPILVGDTLTGTEWVDEGGAGHAELVIRDAADGQLRDRVVLPDGQPIDMVQTGPGTVAISYYRPATNQILLLDVDLNQPAVRAESVVTDGLPDAAYRRVTMAAGPAALTVEVLVAVGPEPGPDDYQLHVYGW